MKNTIIISAFLLVTGFGYSQIKKVENTKENLIGKVNGIECTKIGEKYTFIYNDANYIHIDEYKSFTFKDVDDSFDNLYNIIIDGFNDVPEEDIKVKIPEGHLILQYKKVVGVVNLIIYADQNHESGKTSYLTKRRIMKLFGKKKKRK